MSFGEFEMQGELLCCWGMLPVLLPGLPKGAQLPPNAALINWEMPLTILASALQGQLVFAFLFHFLKIKIRTI